VNKRLVEIGSRKFTEVLCLDKPGADGACHEYQVMRAPEHSPSPPVPGLALEGLYAYVKFQKGSVAENGVNGCHQEDLLAIVIDRLQHFQKGDYASRENALALTKVEEAMHWLNHRTAARQARGVEGTSEK